MKKRLLVCDLDNTLYDWVSYFVPSFYAMVETAVAITGCDREKLLNDFRDVHRNAHDSEQPFALLETSTIKTMFPGISKRELIKLLDPAFHAFNSSRKRTLKLYPNVLETLQTLSDEDVRLVAHTESRLYGVVDRFRRLGLTDYFSKIYCRERSPLPHPAGGEDSWLNDFPMEKVTELSKHQWKPSPEVLREICDSEGIRPDQTAYVGDSISKDVLMAKHSGVFAIWAAYGSNHDPSTYESLVRVSHWTPSEIIRARELSAEAKNVSPDFIARIGFSEILQPIESGRSAPGSLVVEKY